MQYQENTFKSFDGVNLFIRGWRPSAQACGVIVIVHGSFEHGGRYTEFAHFLVGHGYAVYAMDLRGHGRSEGPRVGISTFGVFARDIDAFLTRVRMQMPGQPVFVLAHSAGASIVLSFMLTHKPSVIKGVILSAPVLITGNGIPSWLKSWCPVAAQFLPGYRVKVLKEQWLCRDSSVMAAFKKDPLVYHGGVPLAGLAEFLKEVDELRAQAETVDLPILILHGTDDRYADIAGSRELYAKSRSSDKSLRAYEHFYHEVLHEPDKQIVFSDILSWLKLHTEATAKGDAL